jgi:hypothetical protein
LGNNKQLRGERIMKQLIKLICLGALAHRETQASQTSDHQTLPQGGLILRGIDGAMIAQEINLAQPEVPTNDGPTI